jgi:hypothetical protein
VIDAERVRFLLGHKRTFAVPRDRDRPDAVYQGWPVVEAEEVLTITTPLRERKATAAVTIYVVPSGHVAAVLELGLLLSDGDYEVVETRGCEPAPPDRLAEWLGQQIGASVRTAAGDIVVTGTAAGAARDQLPVQLRRLGASDVA